MPRWRDPFPFTRLERFEECGRHQLLFYSKLFGEDDEAVDEEELDKAKAEGENGGPLKVLDFGHCLVLTLRSRRDRQPEERGRCFP
jgi:hypothetical protein